MCFWVVLGNFMCFLLILGNFMCFWLILGNFMCFWLILVDFMCYWLILGNFMCFLLILGNFMCFLLILGNFMCFWLILGNFMCFLGIMSDLLLVNGDARQLVANPHYTILFLSFVYRTHWLGIVLFFYSTLLLCQPSISKTFLFGKSEFIAHCESLQLLKTLLSRLSSSVSFQLYSYAMRSTEDIISGKYLQTKCCQSRR